MAAHPDQLAQAEASHPQNRNARVVARPGGLHFIQGVIVAIYSFVLLGFLTALPKSIGSYLALAGCIAAIGLILRSRRISLEINDQGVLIKNYWKTRSIPWSDVVEIRKGLLTLGPLPYQVVRFLQRSTGKAFPAQATQSLGKDKARVFAALEHQARVHGIICSVKPSDVRR